MFSHPGHSFWIEMLEYIAEEGWGCKTRVDVTGPGRNDKGAEAIFEGEKIYGQKRVWC